MAKKDLSQKTTDRNAQGSPDLARLSMMLKDATVQDEDAVSLAVNLCADADHQKRDAVNRLIMEVRPRLEPVMAARVLLQGCPNIQLAAVEAIIDCRLRYRTDSSVTFIKALLTGVRIPRPDLYAAVLEKLRKICPDDPAIQAR